MEGLHIIEDEHGGMVAVHNPGGADSCSEVFGWDLLSAPFPKFGRTFSTTLQVRTTAGWHCWLAQQCLRLSWGSGTEFARQSP
jgi:hypothetical protein